MRPVALGVPPGNDSQPVFPDPAGRKRPSTGTCTGTECHTGRERLREPLLGIPGEEEAAACAHAGARLSPGYDREPNRCGSDVRNALAVVFALGAATLYGLGNALEHRVASETVAGNGLDPGLLRRLARRPLWVFGMFGDVGAYGLQAAALALGALLLVQPLLACGLLVASPLNARWTHRRIRRREWVAAALLCASLATFLIEASPGGGRSHAPVADWLRVADRSGS